MINYVTVSMRETAMKHSLTLKVTYLKKYLNMRARCCVHEVSEDENKEVYSILNSDRNKKRRKLCVR